MIEYQKVLVLDEEAFELASKNNVIRKSGVIYPNVVEMYEIAPEMKKPLMEYLASLKATPRKASC
jgi:hypothetical protein